MGNIKANRFTALKARVKAEVLRRNQSGSVAPYGAAAYDYTEAPATGKTVRKEHLSKLTEPMRAVNADGIPATPGVVSEADLATMESKLTIWEARGLTEVGKSDCQNGCTGACYGGCATGCSGCRGCSGCGSGCANGCYGCYNACENACASCSDTCDYNCYATCAVGCSGGCKTTCRGGCSAECMDNCDSMCTTVCYESCDTACWINCDNSCTLQGIVN